MSWIKRSLSCFRNSKNNSCERGKKINLKSCDDGSVPSKLELLDKNVQCNFDEGSDGENVGNRVCDEGQ